MMKMRVYSIVYIGYRIYVNGSGRSRKIINEGDDGEGDDEVGTKYVDECMYADECI